MTVEQLIEILKDDNKLWDKEFLNFDAVASANKHSARRDLHAFVMLDKLYPSARNIVGHAEHDIIYLDVDLKALAKAISEPDAVDLKRCGVFYSEEAESLAMFA